jgi:hypothetical protein
MNQSPEPIPVLGPSLPQQVHEAIGKAIEAYALVEGEQVLVLQSVIGSDYPTATIIAFSMNANSRCQMIGELLGHTYKGALDTYWKSCRKFLGKLAAYRNAIAHWHPLVEIYEDQSNRVYIKHVLNHPKSGKLYESLDDQSVLPFIEDCHYIRSQLQDLNNEVLRKPRNAEFDERFGRPLARQNEALIFAVSRRP